MRVIFIALSLFAPLCLASTEEEARTEYLAGIQAYQKSDFSAARAHFGKAQEINPDNKMVLFNWGLSEFQTQNIPLALALWRRVLFLDPDYTPAREAIKYAENSSPTTTWRPENTRSAWFRAKVLSRVSLDKLLLAMAITITLFGYFLLRFLGKLRQARLGQPSPGAPILTTLLGIPCLFLILLSGLKFVDDNKLRGTVIVPTLQVRSGPTAEAAELFNLNAGMEVLMIKKSADWTQVSYPGGIIGWVESSGLFLSSGKVTW